MNRRFYELCSTGNCQQGQYGQYGQQAQQAEQKIVQREFFDTNGMVRVRETEISQSDRRVSSVPAPAPAPAPAPTPAWRTTLGELCGIPVAKEPASGFVLRSELENLERLKRLQIEQEREDQNRRIAEFRLQRAMQMGPSQQPVVMFGVQAVPMGFRF